LRLILKDINQIEPTAFGIMIIRKTHMNEDVKNELSRLHLILDTLLAPQGCAWMKELVLTSLRQYVLEEVYELLEAIDENDGKKMEEELGDVIFNAVLIAKLGSKEFNFSLASSLKHVNDKLTRRNPHIFGEGSPKTLTPAEIYGQWEEIKKQEKGNDVEKKTSEIDAIAKTLPALVRAKKVAGKLRKYGLQDAKNIQKAPFTSEEELGRLLFELIEQAEIMDLDPEIALREAIREKENRFREWETKGKS
jgi:tetrapyrrole methylase family protein / MazG family protein